jgi:2-(1,2-epoxy-1,2-dihydrophenyl)acetyl-CoA isomerase
MAEDILLTDLAGGVFTITLNRPKANAFDVELVDATMDAFSQAETDKDVRAIVLAATGKLFSAGLDLNLAKQKKPLSFQHHLDRTFHPLVLQMRRLEKPILAAINGPVAGAALGIVLACDLRIASENARFVVAFSGIGLAPDSSYFNQPILAGQALALGLVNKVVPQNALQDETQAWAKRLAAGPVYAIGLTKRDFNQAVLPNFAEVLDHEAEVQEIAGQSPEHQEGVTAFFEGREPDYTKMSD